MMKFFLTLLLITNLNISYGQTAEEIFEQMREERAELFEKLDKMMSDDSFFGGVDSFLDDNFFDNSLNRMGLSKSNISVDKVNEADGSISVYIKPASKETQLDIKTNESSITVKSEMKVKEENETGNNKSISMSSSSSTQIIGIPRGYKALDPISIEDGIKISLVPGEADTNSAQTESDDTINSKKIKLKKNRVPIGKMPGEDTI